MPIRAMRLPQDTKVLLDVLPRAFQYPENPAWSVNADEVQNMTELVQRVKRLWPILTIGQAISPALRDLFHGVIWEEDNHPVGIANVLRMGNSRSWQIVNVGVLPAYRRRGIARQLVKASIATAREHNAKQVNLGVIVGNDPAYTLYQSLGFNPFDISIDLEYQSSDLPPDCPPPSLPSLPAGYIVKAQPLTEWQSRYELNKRITPSAVQAYLPVDAARFRIGLSQRLIMTLFDAGMQRSRMAAYAPDGQLVAVASTVARTRPGGVNRLDIMLDPAHGVIADYLIQTLLRQIITKAPGRTIDFQLSDWQNALIDAAKNVGFRQRMANTTMGLIF